MSLFGFSFSSGIALLILAAVYLAAMRNTTHFAFNRLCLIGILITSLAIPFITLPHFQPRVDGLIEAGDAIQITTDAYYGIQPEFDNIIRIAGIIYIAGVLVMIARTVANLVFITYLHRKSHIASFGGFTVRVHSHNRIHAMSWGGDIYISERLFNSEATELNMILYHENAHRSNYHWIDLLLSNAVLAINWYNPAAWFIQHELIEVHEFEADAIASELSGNKINYQLLLIKKTVGSKFQAIADSLNHSSLKKRITMMMKNRSENSARLRSLALLPAIAVSLVLTNSSCVKDAQKEVSQAESEEIQNSEAIANSASETADTNTLKGKLVAYNETDSDTHVVQMTILKEAGEDVTEFIHAVALHTNYPQEAVDKNIQGRVLVEITVDAKGKITNTKIKQGVHELLDKEAIKAINKVIASGTKFNLTPNNDGQLVASVFVVPIDFKLK
ncbi:MAG: M56 family metallopeptidase [Paramuribaculum sp.]|nr:M56 family metallopeptidase [Paramuribaculum sp.]